MSVSYPALFDRGAPAIWSAMPITEVIVAVYAVYAMAKYTKQLSVPEMDDGGNV